MRMSYLTFWTIISFHAVKCDDKYVKSLLRRQIRVTRKERSAGFEESIPRKVQVARNEIAYLTCMVKNIINESVSWLRSRDLHILTVDDDVYTTDERFKILIDAPTNWTLTIDNAQLEDSGIYECQINTQPVAVFPVYLTVFDYRTNVVEEEMNPDVINDEMVVESSKYPREDNESAKILEGNEISVREGAVLNITCEVYIGRNPNNDFVSTTDASNPIRNLSLIWLHNNQVMHDKNSHYGTSIRTKNSSRLIRSRLLILRVMPNDSGEYICQPLKINKKAVIKVEIVNGLQLIVPSVMLLVLLLAFQYIFRHIYDNFL